MNILHYTIGLPPTRHGGSVQYAYDLMSEQVRQGHNVYALTCGDTLFRKPKAYIRKSGKDVNIKTYELANPLTPTLIYGTKSPILQHRTIAIDYSNIRDFILNHQVSIMHIHTLMGIHKDIVKYIKSLGVTIVYTSHDFHGICLHYNLIDYNGNLCENICASKCALCNQDGPSDFFLRVANSSLYHFIKKMGFLKLKKKKISNVTTSSICEASSVTDGMISQYNELLKYYRDYFKLIDKFHFNSLQTQRLFYHFIGDINGKTIPVITRGIHDNRRELHIDNNNIKFGFVGSTKEYKGFPLLKEILIELKSEGIDNFQLYVYGGATYGPDQDCSNIQYMHPYDYSRISDVLYHLDATIIPSKWYETFSLVALESLAHGRPAIVSNHVGAQDIVAEYSPELVFRTKDELKHLLVSILKNPELLTKINSKILSKDWTYSLAHHTKELIQFYN